MSRLHFFFLWIFSLFQTNLALWAAMSSNNNEFQWIMGFSSGLINIMIGIYILSKK